MTKPKVATQAHRIVAAVQHANESGQDRFAYETGHAIMQLRDDGATDSAIVYFIEEMVMARMEVGLPFADWFRPC